MKMYCGQNPKLFGGPPLYSYEGERCHEIGQSFGAKSIAEAAALIKEELRKTYAAQLERRLQEHEMKMPQQVECHEKKDSTSDMVHVQAKIESNEEKMFHTEESESPGFLQQSLSSKDTDSVFLQSLLKPETPSMCEKEIYLDIACESENIVNSEKQILSNSAFDGGLCPTQSTSKSALPDCPLYDSPVTVTGIFQNASVSIRHRDSCSGDENNQTSDDIYDRRTFSPSDPEKSFTPASETIEEECSQPIKKTLKETVIKVIISDSMENIKDISKEDYFSPELISSLPSKQAIYESPFSAQETLPRQYSCGKKLSNKERNKKFSNLSNYRKRHSNTRRKKFSSLRLLFQQSSEEEESSEENSISSSEESSSDRDWFESQTDRHHTSRCQPSSKARTNCDITLEEESLSSASSLEQKHSMSCLDSIRHVPETDYLWDPLKSEMYQPCVSVVDCCKVKRSLKEILECRICLRELQSSGFFSLSSTSDG